MVHVPGKSMARNHRIKPVKKLGRFDENFGYSSRDIRFTTKGNTLYAYCLGKPEEDIMIRSLGKIIKTRC